MTDDSYSREAMTAANWWGDKLRGKGRRSYAEEAGLYGDDSPVTRGSMAEAVLDVRQIIDMSTVEPGSVESFVAATYQYVLNRLERDPTYGVTLSTDYGPEYELREILTSAGVSIGGSALPLKTQMWIRKGSVRVSEGYGASIEDVPLLEG
jgi:hypothetical protein